MATYPDIRRATAESTDAHVTHPIPHYEPDLKPTGFVGVGVKKYRLLTGFVLHTSPQYRKLTGIVLAPKIFTGYLLGTHKKPGGKACLGAKERQKLCSDLSYV
jgi:hypothetical protein